jgi:hypothetical protein
MTRLDYFLKAMNAGAYKSYAWVVGAFCVQKDRPLLQDATYDYQIIFDHTDTDHLYAAIPDETGNRSPVRLDDTKRGIAPFDAKEIINLPANALPLKNPACSSTYGIVLGNMFLLYYPFKDKFQFINDVIPGSFEDTLASLLTDDVKVGEEEDPQKVYVREYLLYGEACGALAGFAFIFASSGSPKALTVDPSVIKLRDKLIKENAHQLHDIKVQAEIEKQVVAADKASFANDPARDFLITGKSFNPTRKKQLTMIGGSAGFGTDGEATFIATSLRDKWKIKDIPSHVNDARAGSYFRGKETQFGGADVKVAYRMAMNSRIAKEFCGTTVGKRITVNGYNVKRLVGLYAVTPSGPKEITKENVGTLNGKTIMYYSPQYCQVDGSSYCATCIGKVYSRLPNGIPSVVANIGDVYMYDKMKRMHGKALATVTLNLQAIAY